MKNRSVNFLLIITALCVGITIGFSLGRNANHNPVQLSGSPAASISGVQAQVAEASAQPSTVSTVPQQVDINTADLEALTALPGIGPVLAQRILDYRQENGAFTSLGELINVDGIGTKRLEAIWDYITIGGKG